MVANYNLNGTSLFYSDKKEIKKNAQMAIGFDGTGAAGRDANCNRSKRCDSSMGLIGYLGFCIALLVQTEHKGIQVPAALTWAISQIHITHKQA